jgi:chromosome segregation ATPase
MLDAFKGLTGGAKAQKQSDDLQGLIDTAREERSALSAMLTQISMRTSKLQQMGKSLELVDQKAGATGGRLDDLVKRIESIEERARSFGEIDARIQSLLDVTAQAQHTVEKLMSPDGDLQKHRQSVQQLSSQTLETHASLDALKKERAGLDEFRAQLRKSQADIKQSVDGAAALKADLDQVRGTATQLAQEYTRLREMSREAREDSHAATETVKEVEKKLGPLMQLQELSKTTEEKLSTLNALAEHVSTKSKALESQKVAVERAIVEANRLNEMVWNMDVQIARLHEGMKQASRSEETVARI